MPSYYQNVLSDLQNAEEATRAQWKKIKDALPQSIKNYDASYSPQILACAFSDNDDSRKAFYRICSSTTGLDANTRIEWFIQLIYTHKPRDPFVQNFITAATLRGLSLDEVQARIATPPSGEGLPADGSATEAPPARPPVEKEVPQRKLIGFTDLYGPPVTPATPINVEDCFVAPDSGNRWDVIELYMKKGVPYAKLRQI